MEAEKEAQAPSKREALSMAIQIEKEERGRRCMARIEAILKEENCLLTANIETKELAPQTFGLVTNIGIMAH